ncbi:hypothetical protein EKO27_g8446 [Xylaria grammica]|uniref:C2H2-type domain-containing protein n=1 Tax=Xylaria grammica TaxID=363999 RepID=A0A439CX88_9PEZI|nr:hypothetical protein EKO27_g8446 [Xylaria grammica]
MLGYTTSLGGEVEPVEAGTLLAGPDSHSPHSQKKYQCPQCPSSFKRPENLKRHQRGHDESRRFMCHICDKSFARSDILGRHVAIHTPLEQRNDNPQRKRACLECEEHPFKEMKLHTWSSLASESGDYEAIGAGWADPQSPLEATYTGGDTLLQGPGPSPWQVESSPVAYGGPSIHSALPHTQPHPYQLGHHGNRFAPPLQYDELPHQDAGPYPGSLGDINTNNMNFITGDAELQGMVGAYEQTISMPFDLATPSFHQHSPSAEFLQSHHARSSSLGSRHLNAPLDAHYTHGSNLGVHTTTLTQPGALDFQDTPRSHEYPDGAQASSIDFDSQEALFQPVQTPYPHPIDLKPHDFIAADAEEPCRDGGSALLYGATATGPRTSQRDFDVPLKLYHNGFGHGDGGGDGVEETEGFGMCFENTYTQ